MRYVVAVSGGVDSVVLLDQLVAAGEHELIVAHFDHGIRPDSADDARFVEGLAEKYGLPYVTAREELGAGASEDKARQRRYAFLRATAQKYRAIIATAHHADDVIETVAINVQRGTGWRGVAVMHAKDIVRPLLDVSKTDIIQYAMEKQLEWVEDSTNRSNDYLRNRLRRRIAKDASPVHKKAVLAIWQKQIALRTLIERELQELTKQCEHSRYQLINMDDLSAKEVLRAIIVAKTNVSPTRPQLERAILAIKTARPRATFDVGDGVKLVFTVRRFIVETP